MTLVNGMGAVVDSYDPGSDCLEVITDTGKRHSVYSTTDDVDEHGLVTCFLVRSGYACTAQKAKRCNITTCHDSVGRARLSGGSLRRAIAALKLRCAVLKCAEVS